MHAATSELSADRPTRARGGSDPRKGRSWSGSPRLRPTPPAPPPSLGAAPPEIAILDSDGRIVEVNQAWREAAAAQGFSPGDAGVGAAYIDVATWFLPDLDRAAVEISVQRLLSGELDDARHTCAVKTPDGLRWRQVQITPLSAGAAGRLVVIHDDRTELETTRKALQTTSSQLLRARDEERRRIAIELHDSTSQHLAAINMGLGRLRRASPDDGPGGAIIDEIAVSLSEAVRETRALSYLIQPRGLGENGLSADVLQFLQGFGRRAGMEVALEADDAVNALRPVLQHAALRIIQEAVLNAYRHGHARHVWVGLGLDHGSLTVSVRDDGCGIELEAGEPCLGVGIPGMRARAQQFSGALAISSDESGTRIVATLPVS